MSDKKNQNIKKWSGLLIASVVFGLLVVLGATVYFVWLSPKNTSNDGTGTGNDGTSTDNNNTATGDDGVDSFKEETTPGDKNNTTTGGVGGGGFGTVKDETKTDNKNNTTSFSSLWSKHYGVESTVVTSGNLIAAGSKHVVMYLHRENKLLAFGNGSFGQLGSGDTRNVDKTPVDVKLTIPTDTAVKQITCGYEHTMVLLSNGDLYAFGRNNQGQLGLGHTSDQAFPVKVMSNVSYVSAGSSVTFIVSKGVLYACGYNAYGHLGAGNYVTSTSLKQITFDTNLTASNIKQISSGGHLHTIILFQNGTVCGSGSGSNGQLADLKLPELTGKHQTRSTFGIINNIPSGSRPIQIVCGMFHTSILLENGEIWSVGDNSENQFGDGTTTSSSTWIKAGVTTGASRLFETTSRHMLAYDFFSVVYGWGSNGYKQLGHIDSSVRVPTQILQNVSQNTVFAGGHRFSVCLTDRDTCYVSGVLLY